MTRSIMLALGGNAILPQGRAGTIEDQIEITDQSLRPLAEWIQPGDKVVLTHGNGPVVGNILIRNDAASDEIPPMPVDVCDADSQGGLGYMLAQSMENMLRSSNKNHPVTAVITRVRVDPNDPALQNPTKPIGPFYSQERATALAAAKGWQVKEDAGRGWRRVIGSPKPVEVVEMSAIKALLEAGQIVICVGGGGVPVAQNSDGGFHGVEAVIDKDRASAFLASKLGIETLLIVTGVTHVAIRFNQPDQKNLDRITVAEASQYLEAGEFGEGSMKPKMEAALDFLKAGGKEVIITHPDTIGEALQGTSGTRIVP